MGASHTATPKTLAQLSYLCVLCVLCGSIISGTLVHIISIDKNKFTHLGCSRKIEVGKIYDILLIK
ncbi:MAG: hypothetical protein ACKO2Z_17665, partial [Sphaerospermopsis kisseleviana]